MAKEMIAMLLAGGQGSRLYALTEKLAKPAVPFGGKYRIIDFPLSNCVNSGIDTVGILTQYQPMVLNEYIGNGQPWDLDRLHGGVHVLPPYQKASGSDWYKGTANAIYQNIPFIESYDPEYVIILPETRSANRTTVISYASIRKRAQNSALRLWKCHGRRHPVSDLWWQMKMTKSPSSRKNQNSRNPIWHPWVSTFSTGIS